MAMDVAVYNATREAMLRATANLLELRLEEFLHAAASMNAMVPGKSEEELKIAHHALEYRANVLRALRHNERSAA